MLLESLCGELLGFGPFDPLRFNIQSFGDGFFNGSCISENKLAAVSDEIRLTVRDLNTGLETASCTGHTATITIVKVSSNIIISGSADKTVRVWDLNSGKVLFICEGHEDVIVYVSEQENCLISVSLDGVVRLWDRVTGRPKAVYQCRVLGNVICENLWLSEHRVTMQADSVESNNKILCIWDRATGKQILQTEETYEDEFLEVIMSDNKLIAGSTTGEIIDVECGCTSAARGISGSSQ